MRIPSQPATRVSQVRLDVLRSDDASGLLQTVSKELFRGVGRRSRCSLVPPSIRDLVYDRLPPSRRRRLIRTWFSVLLCQMRAWCAHHAGSEQRERFSLVPGLCPGTHCLAGSACHQSLPPATTSVSPGRATLTGWCGTGGGAAFAARPRAEPEDEIRKQPRVGQAAGKPRRPTHMADLRQVCLLCNNRLENSLRHL